MKNKSIISIAGKKNHGKSLAAKILKYYSDPLIYEKLEIKEYLENYEVFKSQGWQIKSWGDKVKQVCSIILNEPIEKFYDQEFKSSFLPDIWYINGEKITVRQFMQKIATEAIRDNFNKNTWIYALTNELDSNPLIIDDTRLLNEIQAIDEKQGIQIKIERQTTSYEWQKVFKGYFIILDPDGWDRKNFEYSFNEEIISQTEFFNRVYRSTCQFHRSLTKQNAELNHRSENEFLEYDKWDCVIINNGSVEDLSIKIKALVEQFNLFK